MENLSAHAATVHHALTEGRETLLVEYGPSFDLPPEAVTESEVAAAFDAALQAVRRDEIQRGSTLLGPQRDDLCFRVGPNKENTLDVKTFGSQGQQRTVALSLRLAERRLIEEMVGESPVVLLDDVLSDLDEFRRAQIFALALGGGQTFLTVTDLAARRHRPSPDLARQRRRHHQRRKKRRPVKEHRFFIPPLPNQG